MTMNVILIVCVAALVLSILFVVAIRQPESASKLNSAMYRAGWRSPWALSLFFVLTLICVALGVLASVWLYHNVALDIGMKIYRFYIVAAPFVIGVLLPLAVWWQAKSKQRRKIHKEISYVINFIILYLQAGYTIDHTLERLSIILTRYKYVFANEVVQTLNELRYLGDRSKAWENMVQRVGEDDLLFFVRLLQEDSLQNEHTLQSLNRQSDVLHKVRINMIEERASRAAGLVFLPIGFLIMPALVILLLAPAFILAFL